MRSLRSHLWNEIVPTQAYPQGKIQVQLRKESENMVKGKKTIPV